MKQLQDEIDKYVSSGKEEQLEESRRLISRLEKKAEKYDGKKDEILKNIDTIKEEAAQQEVTGNFYSREQWTYGPT